MQTQFTGTLTAADSKRHIAHHFDLPSDVEALHIVLSFDPPNIGDVRNMLTLTIFDPNGFRGAGHRGGNRHEVTLTQNRVTPGYFVGPLPPGKWTVQIDTHMLMPGRRLDYSLTIDAAEDVPTEKLGPMTSSRRASSNNDAVLRAEPGWYRGDLHSHTIHSDASWDVADLVNAAKEKKLDFIYLTDHNTTSPLVEMFAQTSPELLTLGGMELTTFWGHAVCLGATEWVDWRVDELGDGMAAIAKAVNANDGQAFIIAHPRDIGDPYCTGCAWIYPKMHPGPARLVEVWNGAWWDGHMPSRYKNENSLRLWYRWLNEGIRMYATAGSDVHGPKHYANGPGFNVVYAENLSHQGLIKGIRQGQSYLSAGPTVDLRATANGHTIGIGERVIEDGAGEVELIAEWSDCAPESMLHIVVDGSIRQAYTIGTSGDKGWSLNNQDFGWCLIELRGENGEMLALTNPIFGGGFTPSA